MTSRSNWANARRGLEDHPTVKPIAMLADALFDLTNRREIVLDPFRIPIFSLAPTLMKHGGSSSSSLRVHRKPDAISTAKTSCQKSSPM